MLRRLLIPAAAAAAVVALPAPAAHAAKCGDKTNFAGTQYVINFKASGVSCGKATKVVKAHQGAGAGSRTVKGYKCSQKVVQRGVTSIYAKVRCKKGGKSVKYAFQKST